MNDQIKKLFLERWGDAIAAYHIKELAMDYFEAGYEARAAMESKPVQDNNTTGDFQYAKHNHWCNEHAKTCLNNPVKCDDCNPMAWAYESKPVKSLKDCATCLHVSGSFCKWRQKGFHCEGYDSWEAPYKPPETAIDRLKRMMSEGDYDELMVCNAILELDSRIAELRKEYGE